MSEADTLDRYADRRRHSRRPVNKAAELTLRTGEDVFDCIVIDESDGGLQVELAEEIDLPDEVVIRFSDHASQLVRRCWSLGTKVGYQFIEPAPAMRRQIEDVPPPARAAPATIGDYACITAAALELDRTEMAFIYPAERVHALLRSNQESAVQPAGLPDAVRFFRPRPQFSQSE
jgi:hypothetical protein